MRILAASTACWISSRDRYRHVVETIAKRSPARRTRGGAPRHPAGPSAARRKSGNDRAAHVGFYLIDKGLPELEGTAQVRRSTAEALQRMSGRFPLCYIWVRSS